MDGNPYQSPSPQPPPKTATLKRSKPVVVIDGFCHCCGVGTSNIKVFWVTEKVYCLFFFWWIKRRMYAACPTCMRKILWRRCRAKILSGNMMWLLHALPKTIVSDFETRLGQNRKLPEILGPLLELLVLVLIIAFLVGIVYALVQRRS